MKLTDEQLREELRQGQNGSEIARLYDLDKSYVYKRIKTLKQDATALAVIAPDESRQFVRSNLTALDHINDSLSVVRKMLLACDQWLTDPDNADRYWLGPRSNEVMVTYLHIDEAGEAKFIKKPLHLIIRAIEDEGLIVQHHLTEVKHADVRELVLKTAQECRQTVTAAVELATLLADAKTMQVMRDAIIEEIRTVEPASAERIARAIQRRLILFNEGGDDATS